mmetsp:Transcript_25878/g.40162  ORF Transcript_25878/g.40162 Transcript_25878/m.40162 type:complete len:128 (+) Transcript_25878:1433-1816(+)
MKNARMIIQMPHLPYEFGYEYTVARYRAHLQNPDRPNLHSFSSFRENLWKDAISNSELSQFFEECIAKLSTKGKYYGTFLEEGPSLYIELCMWGRNPLRFEKCESALPDIPFLRSLEDFFDHNEDPI